MKLNIKISNTIDEIRVRGVLESDRQLLENISENLGLTLTTFLRMEFKKIIEGYPDNLKQTPPNKTLEAYDAAIAAMTAERNKLIN